MIRIIEYNPDLQQGIDEMMKGIASEFSEAIRSPQSTRINEVYVLPDQKFWVAVYDSFVVGTIGLVLYSDNNAVLKRMMVDKNYRGGKHQTAKLLLEKSFEWGRQMDVKKVFLGTMDQFKAAQGFYEKNGFTKIHKDQLPKDYDSNPIDTVYYSTVL